MKVGRGLRATLLFQHLPVLESSYRLPRSRVHISLAAPKTITFLLPRVLETSSLSIDPVPRAMKHPHQINDLPLFL